MLPYRRFSRYPSFAQVMMLGAPLVVAAPSSAYALGEQTGSLSGVVKEAETGLPMPGVEVRATSTTQGGGPSPTVTDQDGRYELLAMPPGPYEVTLSLPNAVPLQQRLAIRPGEHRTSDVSWKITLTGDEPLIVHEKQSEARPDSTRTGSVLRAETTERIASQRYPADLALLVPGVSDPTESGSPSIKGALAYGNRYLIDGIDVSDPVTGTSTSQINFDAIGSIEVLTGGTEAEYNTLGGIINVITKNGSKKWGVDASLYLSHSALEVHEGVGSGPLNGRRPYSRSPALGSQLYIGNLNLGGPLVKDRLWVYASIQYAFSELSLPPGPPLEVQHPSYRAQEVVAHAKLTYAPNERHRVNFSVRGSWMPTSNTAQSNYLLGVAEDSRLQYGVFSALRWDGTLSRKVQISTHASFSYLAIDSAPQGQLGSIDTSGYDAVERFSAENRQYDAMRPRHENQDDGTVWYQGNLRRSDRRYVVQLDPAVSFMGRLLGMHHAKLGVQSRFLSDHRHTELPGGTVFYDAGGGPGEAGLCRLESGSGRGCSYKLDVEPNDSESTGVAVGLFIQDRWQPVSRLLLLPGVRFDYGYSRNVLDEQITGQWGIAPRIGFTLDLRGDQNTILAGFYGRATDTASLLPATMARPTGRIRSYLYNADTKQFAFSSQLGGPGGYLLDATATPPTVDEVTVSLRHHFFKSITAVVDYTYKHLTNLWDLEEQNRIWDPSGSWVAGYKNGMPQDIKLFTTRPDNQRTYHGVDFMLGAQRGALEFFAGYTLSWLYGTTQDAFGQLYGNPDSSPRHNPRLEVYALGFLPEDARHQLRLRAAYEIYGVNLGFTLYYATGTPVTPRYKNPGDANNYSLLRAPIGLAPGSDRNDPEQFAELRNPDRVVANARLSWNLKPLIKQRLVLIADVFNLFNLRTSLLTESRDIATYGQSVNRMLPLSVQLAARFVY